MLWKIGLRFLKKNFFFKAGKCDLFGIFDDGGFWAKGEFQEGSLRVKKTILIFTVVKARDGEGLNIACCRWSREGQRI